MKIKTENLENQLKHASEDSLEDLITAAQTFDFCNEMNRLLSENNLSKGELIKDTLLDRNYAYQILQGTKMGSKDKILQLCLAMQCTLEETNRLLTLSDNSKLYAKVKREMLIIYALEHGLSVMETNELLSQYEQTLF